MKTIVYKKLLDMGLWAIKARVANRTIGLVPTMGALHAGHASLLTLARKETDLVVATIFVNPMQFGPHEDLARYPRPFERDLEICEREGVDVVFAPEVSEIYQPGFRSFVEVSELQDLWEGASRPGHFRGVATVVLKLFNLIRPSYAYFGQKDAQQVRIIRQMVHDLLPAVGTLRIGDTVREPDGLALSSRNQYLSAAERSAAPVLYRALTAAKQRIESGERDAHWIVRLMTDTIATAPEGVLDYAAVVDDDTLKPVDHIAADVLLLLAVRFGTTRLIDNMPVKISPE